MCGVFSARVLGSGIRASPLSPRHTTEQGKARGARMPGFPSYLGAGPRQGPGKTAPGSFRCPRLAFSTRGQGRSARSPAVNPTLPERSRLPACCAAPRGASDGAGRPGARRAPRPRHHVAEGAGAGQEPWGTGPRARAKHGSPLRVPGCARDEPVPLGTGGRRPRAAATPLLSPARASPAPRRPAGAGGRGAGGSQPPAGRAGPTGAGKPPREGAEVAPPGQRRRPRPQFIVAAEKGREK